MSIAMVDISGDVFSSPISIINKYHLKCNKQKLIDKKNSPIMAIAMVAMLAFGGTYAYFTASAGAASDDTTLGTIALGDSTVTIETSAVNVLPSESIGVTLAVTDASNRASYIFIDVAGSVAAVEGSEVEAIDIEVTLTVDETETLVGVLKSVEVEGETVYYILTEDNQNNTEENESISVTTEIVLPKTINNDYQGGKLTVTLNAKSIQAAGFAGAAEAYAAWTENGTPKAE